MKKIIIIALATLPLLGIAQKSKVQTAWRNLNDYESTLKGNNPDITYLMKAKENIDLALSNDETKNTAKANAYKCRIMYALYQYNFKQESKKLEATITDKNARSEAAYIATPIAEFEQAWLAVNKIKEVDAKYYDKILGPKKDVTDLDEDELNLNKAVLEMIVESSNIAIVKYKAKQFADAADYFHKLATLRLLVIGIKDTASYYNACICAIKLKDPKKVMFYNSEMINNNIATAYNYQAIYESNINAADTAGALDILKKGREAFPNDLYLMNKETEMYIQSGKQDLAVVNLQKAIEKDSKNALLHFVLGDVYNSIANPKNKKGQDTTKPENYDELMLNAEKYYQNSIDLKSTNKDNYFNVLFNMGALHYNHGVTLYNKSMAKTTIADLSKKQKEFEKQSGEFYKKALPFFEQALSIKEEDASTMTALRKLYYLVGNEAKGNEMSERLKKIK